LIFLSSIDNARHNVPNLNVGPIMNISLVSALRGLETSPNIIKCGILSFPTIFCSSTTKSNFDPLTRLYDLLELRNLYQSIALELLRNLRTITVSHGSATTVVRATQQVNGKWQFWGCQNSVTPEPID